MYYLLKYKWWSWWCWWCCLYCYYCYDCESSFSSHFLCLLTGKMLDQFYFEAQQSHLQKELTMAEAVKSLNSLCLDQVWKCIIGKDNIIFVHNSYLWNCSNGINLWIPCCWVNAEPGGWPILKRVSAEANGGFRELAFGIIFYYFRLVNFWCNIFYLFASVLIAK